MRKITFTLLSMFFVLPCMANIHINPDAVTEVVAKHFPNKQVECIREYNAQLKASNGAGIAASKLWNVCAAGGLDIKQPAGKEKCRTFVNELTSKGTVKFYDACGKDKSMTGAVCVNDFSALVVNMQQAQGLAKLYARSKSDNTIQCRTKPRMDAQTVYSNNVHTMGMSSTTNTPYVQCTSYNSNKFYEFRFSSIDGNIDATNHKNFKTGVCQIFGYKYISKKPEAPADNHEFDICDGIKNESACNKLDQVISAGNIGYIASWGPLGYKTGRTGYQITSKNFPYCVLNESVAAGNDGYLMIERTAFGLDGRVFLKAGVQRKGSNEIKQQIRTYVENTMGKGNVKSFSCEDTYHTIKLKGRSGTDDMVRCTINDQVVEFFFDDLSEAWGIYDKSGREAMSCIAWGGTFTGKKCIGLDQKMCDKVRDANAESCPECKKIKWNDKAKVCELPASVSATYLKRGLTYSAIVGGAVVSVVITVGTAGAGGVTAGTAIIMIVESAGAVIELGAQLSIDTKADRFFVESANCKTESCAKELVNQYLTELARIGRDLTDAEAEATDKEMARLIDLIPTNSSWWIENLRNDDGTSLLEKANDNGWTPAQVWRAVGIGMQFAGVASSITGWIMKKTGYLSKALDRTSRILLNNARIAEKNIVKVDELDDVGKEWYKLWQEYAPKNQTLDEFMEMADGDLNEMKQMVKDWTPRSERPIINAQIDKQLDDIKAEVNHRQEILDVLMDKYYIDAMPTNPDELAELYANYPELEQAAKNLEYAKSEVKNLQEARAYNNTNYSTYNPDFSKTFDSQIKIRQLKAKQEELDAQLLEYNTQINLLQDELDALKKQKASSGYGEFNREMELKAELNELQTKEQDITSTIDKLHNEQQVLKKSLPTQWEIAEKFPLKNLGNVVNERANLFNEIIKANPEIQSKLDEKVWATLSSQERANVAQQILDEYAAKTGTPVSQVKLNDKMDASGRNEPGTLDLEFNPTKQMQYADGMVDVMSHEHGHLIDEWAPNEGALGEQYNYYADKIYSNKEGKGYRVGLSEQSSYKIGPNVSREVTGTTDYGKEYALEEAKRKAVESIELGGAFFGTVAPATGGIVAGTVKQVSGAIQNKNDKK